MAARGFAILLILRKLSANNAGQPWTLVFQTADRKGYCRVELGNCDEVLRV